MIILDLNKMKVETKWDQLKNKVRNNAVKAYQWVKKNPEIVGGIATIGTAIIGGSVKLGKSIARSRNLNKERYNKERYIYDRSLGMYLHTKRPLRNKDFIAIQNRRKKGEKLADILEKMNILD